MIIIKKNINMSNVFRLILILFVFALSSSQKADEIKTNLEQGFINPPSSAKPRVWWHWMNGNISKEGIKADLEWMQRIGIGGFQNFEANMSTPQVVKNRLTYMTPEWKDAFRYSTGLADSIGLEMAIAGSPGWSESGGPWVDAEDGMKKIVWTEIRGEEGMSNLKLPCPSSVTGPFQNLPKKTESFFSTDNYDAPSVYKDVAVVAFKLPVTDHSLKDLKAVVTSSGGNFALTQLTDGDLATSTLLPRDDENGYAWIQFYFPQQQTIKAITMVGGGEPGMYGWGTVSPDSRILEASNDGKNFDFVCNVPPGAILQQTIAIPTTTAKYFRVKVKNPPPKSNPVAAMTGKAEKPILVAGTEIAEIYLHTADVINCFEEKAAFATVTDINSKATRATNDVVSLSDVVNLTDKMNPDGSLNWTVPEGEWNIVRYGYSLLGITNHPASPEATGLEVDKLDPVAINKYFTNYLDQYKDATGGLMGDEGGLQYLITDSWEAGAQNWTDKLPEEFRKRRGYDIIPWMPVLTGHIVKSAEASEQFLFDFRKTLSEMVAEYHYDGLTEILKKYGMKRYSESHENGRALIGDGMDIKRTASIPMSACWTEPVMGKDMTAYEADLRESASVAHIYGQNIAAAESFTSLGLFNRAYSYYPEKLKPTADLELANGLNRFVIHTSVHQPVDDKIPGISLDPFGQWFTRHETWAENAKPWIDYLARSSYMLQQGKFVADIVYYYGEDNNITSLFGKKLPCITEGYNYDFSNSDALINLLTVKDGKLVTPSGMSYHLLVLDSNAVNMALPALRKIEKLVNDGAVICGIKPLCTPSLADDQNEFNRIVSQIWDSGNSRVYTGKTIEEVLSLNNVSPDFTYTKPDPGTKLLGVHRETSDGDIYWVNNRSNKSQDLEVSFRVEGKVPEIWHPETGKIESASYIMEDHRTRVSLNLDPNGAQFVVFRQRTNLKSVSLPKEKESLIAELEGPWKVTFQTDRGAPAQATFNSLQSWTENEDTGIKYFSGTATYNKEVVFEKEVLNNKTRTILDLGEVNNLAEVIVNGKSVGILWKKPFKIDISGALKAGKNTFEIKVTNVWVNRLIGDMQPDVSQKITCATMSFYTEKSRLVKSGLLGPVKVVALNRTK